jgi:CcmD family protein
MNMWGYVILAYGIVWLTILLYTVSLKRRCHAAEKELEPLRAGKES